MLCLQLACETQAPHKVGIVAFFVGKIYGRQMVWEQEALLFHCLEDLEGGKYAIANPIAREETA